MTTSIFGKEKGLKIVLPEKGAQVKIKSENVLPVNVNERGQVLIGDAVAPVNLADVNVLVAERLRQNPKLAVALRVNRRAPYQIMIETFDQLRVAFKNAGVGDERISLVPVQEVTGAPQ
jgi:biopolymer transport protein ExbD